MFSSAAQLNMGLEAAQQLMFVGADAATAFDEVVDTALMLDDVDDAQMWLDDSGYQDVAPGLQGFQPRVDTSVAARRGVDGTRVRASRGQRQVAAVDERQIVASAAVMALQPQQVRADEIRPEIPGQPKARVVPEIIFPGPFNLRAEDATIRLQGEVSVDPVIETTGDIGLLGRTPKRLVVLKAGASRLTEPTDVVALHPTISQPDQVIRQAGVEALVANSDTVTELSDVLATQNATAVSSELQTLRDRLLDVSSVQVTGLNGSAEAANYGTILVLTQMAKQPLVDAIATLQSIVDQPDRLASPEGREQAINSLIVLGFQPELVGVLNPDVVAPTNLLTVLSEIVLTPRGQRVIEVQARELAEQAVASMKQGQLPSNLVLGRPDRSGVDDREREPEVEEVGIRVVAAGGTTSTDTQAHQ